MRVMSIDCVARSLRNSWAAAATTKGERRWIIKATLRAKHVRRALRSEILEIPSPLLALAGALEGYNRAAFTKHLRLLAVLIRFHRPRYSSLMAAEQGSKSSTEPITAWIRFLLCFSTSYKPNEKSRQGFSRI